MWVRCDVTDVQILVRSGGRTRVRGTHPSPMKKRAAGVRSRSMARWMVVWMCFAGAALAGSRCARAGEGNRFDAIQPASPEQGQKPGRVASSGAVDGPEEVSDTPIAPLPPGS